MCPAIQDVRRARGLPTGHTHHRFVRIILRGHQVSDGRGSGRAHQENKIRGIAPVQRNLRDPLRIHHLPDSGAMRLHHASRGFDDDLVAHRADLQRRVDGRVAVHLQHDIGLHKRAEPLLRDLETIGSNRQGLKHVSAVRSSDRVADQPCGRLRHANLRVWNGEAGRILNRPRNLRDGCRLRPKSNAAREKKNCHRKTRLHGPSPY